MIIDDKDEEIENVIIVDDGNGAGIRIPAMLITKKDGEVIKDYLMKNQHIALLASFELDKPDDWVEVDFWYTSSDDRALDFLRDYRENHLKLESKVLLEPHFAFWTCEKCDKAVLERDCYGNGAYCAINEKNLNTTGRDILDEDIRQACLHKILLEKKKEALWWDYVAEFHQECYNEVTKECSKNAHTWLKLNWKDTQKCFDDSFYDKKAKKNSYFEKEKEYY